MTDMSEITAEGVTQLRLAAEQGDVQAMSSLAKCYWHGTGVRQDKEIAIAWWQRAAAQGDSSAQFTLALCKLNGDGFVKDEHWAIREIATLADAGNKEALEWQAETRAEADSGDSEALYLLALSLPKEEGAKAAELLKKATEAGNLSAQSELGIRLCKGDGIDKDAATGVELLQRAVDQGCARAVAELAQWYEHQPRSKANETIVNTTAFNWLKRAADSGDAQSMVDLSAYYQYEEEAMSVGIPVDQKLANEILMRAAKLGNAQAQAWVVDENGAPIPSCLRLAVAQIADNSKVNVDLDLEGMDVSTTEISGYLGTFFDGWPMRGDIHEAEFCAGELDRVNTINDEAPFWKCANVAFWARYINESGYQNALGLTNVPGKSNAYTDFLSFYLGRWSTIAEIDEFRRVFYWVNGFGKPLEKVLDSFDVWQLIDNLTRETVHEYDNWGYENYKNGLFAAFVDQWMHSNKTMLAETYPLLNNSAWDGLETTLNDEINRLRVVMNVILRSSLVKLFGSYEKHVATIMPVLENKFAYYEDYKAYVDALPSDKNDEFYQRLREKLGFVTEEGYRHSFAW